MALVVISRDLGENLAQRFRVNFSILPNSPLIVSRVYCTLCLVPRPRDPKL